MAGNLLEKIKEKFDELKEKIPFLNKSEKSSSDDEDEFEDKTNPKYEDQTNSEPQDDSSESEVDDSDEEDEDEGEDEDEEAKKLKKKKIIYGFVVLGLLYLGYDELTKEENIEVPPVQVVKKPKAKPKPKVKTQQPQEDVQKPIVAQETTPEAPSLVDNTANEKVIEQAAPVENSFEEKIVEEPVPVEVKDEEIEISENFNLQIEEPSIVDEEQISPEPTSIDSQLTDIIKKVEDENENRLDNLEYTSPPNYENFGESLVYNCKGQHWACVDKEAHFQCLNNYRWAKQTENKPECSNSKVLATASDCRKLQLYNINMVVEKPDCD